MRAGLGGRVISIGGLAIRESPLVYPVQPEVPEAIERLVAAFAAAPGPLRILEIGTGTGIIACALAAAGHAVTATDILPGAVRLARRNARDNRLAFECRVCDLCEGVSGPFDRVVFNVPNTVAVTPAATFFQYLGARLLPKPAVEWVGAALARRVVRNGAQKRALYERLLETLPARLAPGASLALLVPAVEAEWLSRHPAVARARIEPLREAKGVRLILLELRSQPATPTA